MKGLLLEIYYKNIKNIFIMNAFLILVWILINLFADIQIIVFAYFAVVIFANSLLVLFCLLYTSDAADETLWV